VAEKHDFRSIQRKIPQNPDFALNQDMNPVLYGDTAADIAKKLNKIFCENRFSQQKTRFSQKSERDNREKPQKSESNKKTISDFRGGFGRVFK
jgi:hypothetical protein